jgi:Family of unknown function (DUF5954)
MNDPRERVPAYRMIRVTAPEAPAAAAADADSWKARAGYPDLRFAGPGRLDEQRADDLEVAGRRFRVVRVERLVRIGPDGPEGPRPSDPDPQLPVMAQEQQSRDQGLLTGEDADAPIELDEDARRFVQLFQEEEERRKARLQER